MTTDVILIRPHWGVLGLYFSQISKYLILNNPNLRMEETENAAVVKPTEEVPKEEATEPPKPPEIPVEAMMEEASKTKEPGRFVFGGPISMKAFDKK